MAVRARVDLANLKAAIVAAARQVFQAMRAAHPDERFYAFALYTTGMADYIIPTANSLEGLEQAARRYETEEAGTFEKHLQSLKWSPCDWAYHGHGDDAFDGVNQLLQQADLFSLSDSACDRLLKGIFRACINALRDLDREGCFGTSQQRQGITLLLLMGDQSTNQILEWSAKFNPRPVHARIEADLRRPRSPSVRPLGTFKVYESTRAVISSRGDALVACGDGWLAKWSLPDCQEKVFRSRQMSGRALALSPDGDSAFVSVRSSKTDKYGLTKSQLRRFDLESGKKILDFSTQTNVHDAVFSPDGVLLVVEGGLLRSYDSSTGAVLRELNPHNSQLVHCVTFCARGRFMATCGDDQRIVIWDAQTWEEVGSIASSARQLALSPDSKLLASCTYHLTDDYETDRRRDAIFKVWSVESGTLFKEFDRFPTGMDNHAERAWAQGVSALTFSPSGNQIGVGHAYGADVWDLTKNSCVDRVSCDMESVERVIFHPTGKQLVIVGRIIDGPPVLVWDLAQAQ